MWGRRKRMSTRRERGGEGGKVGGKVGGGGQLTWKRNHAY